MLGQQSKKQRFPVTAEKIQIPAFRMYTVSQKNDNDVAHYNFNTH